MERKTKGVLRYKDGDWERVKIHRNILVCYDNHRCIGWMTKEEFSEAKDINWYSMEVEGRWVQFKYGEDKTDGEPGE